MKTAIIIYLSLLVLAILYFAKCYYNACQKEKKDKIIKPLDRKQQELIRKEQDKAENTRRFNSKLR